MRNPRSRGIGCALLAAGLFGASTPLAKLFLGDTSAFLMAGLLYLGSGIGLALWSAASRFLGSKGSAQPGLSRRDWLWFLGAAGFGGVLAPVFLMLGLARTDASTAALLLNLEAVATALIAWFIFRENVNRQVALGFFLMVGGAFVLSWTGSIGWRFSWGTPLVIAACVCWGIDNNLTRNVSGCDPVVIAGLKGLIAGGINTLLAFVLGTGWPSGSVVWSVGLIGFLGYGLSLVFFILALRHLGTARTGAYFSTAPFAGALLALVLWPETFSWVFVLAGALMALGVGLHVTEIHEHGHVHEPLEHEHLHVHDEHHRHEHAPGDPAGEPHSHWHAHGRLVHRHRHDPDIHHQHSH